MKSIKDYVELEPSIFETISSKEKSLLNNTLSQINLAKYSDIVFFATGSSSNAAYTASDFISNLLRLPVYVVEPSLALANGNVFSKTTLYFAISEGGHSRSIKKIVERVQENNLKIIVITSNLNSPVGKVAVHKIYLGMKEEMPYVSAGFSSTVLLLFYLSLELAYSNGNINKSRYQNLANQAKQMIEFLPIWINRSEQYVNNHIEKISQKSRFIFIGYGSTYGIAREGETKITETFGTNAFGKELEEYMHGPYLGLQAKDLIIFLDPNGSLQKRELLLKKFLTEHVKDVCLFSNSNRYVFSSELDLKFNQKFEPILTSILLVVPIHLLAFDLAGVAGNNLEVSRYSDFDKITNSKI